MDAPKLGFAVVNHVLPLPQVEIDDVDGVHFLDVVVILTALDMLGHQPRRAKKHSLEVGKLVLALHLNQEQVAAIVACQQVHAVLLALLAVAVALPLKDVGNPHRLAKQGGEEAFQHVKVGLVAQQAFQSPVETDICPLLFHCCSLWFVQSYRQFCNWQKISCFFWRRK